jgi:parallel beta-helix repeat protein
MSRLSKNHLILYLNILKKEFVMIKKISFLIVSILILGLIFAGCSVLNNSGVVPTSEPDIVPSIIKALEVNPDAYPLYADQDWLVGEVLVWDDGEELCVKYQLNQDILDEDWLITKTHLAVAISKDGIPHNKKGIVQPGQFPYGDDDLAGREYYQECIPFTELEVNGDDTIFIAAHAIIEKPKGKKNLTEGAWGAEEDGGTLFVPSGDWATYFEYIVDPCDPCTGRKAYNNDTGVEYTTIQEAIDSAASGETIIVCPGTYYENIEFSGSTTFGPKNITVRSTDPSDPAIVAATIIDGGGIDSVVKFSYDNSTLEGFTIQNGDAYYGGGINLYDYYNPSITTPTITGNIITGNRGTYGGGIFMYGSAPTITGNEITGNTAAYQGGGIHVTDNSSPAITGNTITDNISGGWGAGICVIWSSPAITGNTITDNTGVGYGGGVYVDYQSGATIVGGADASDTDNFNSICSNSPDQIVPDTYPNNDIDTVCP